MPRRRRRRRHAAARRPARWRRCSSSASARSSRAPRSGRRRWRRRRLAARAAGRAAWADGALPPELRARVLSFHPEAAAMPAVDLQVGARALRRRIVEQLSIARAAAGPLAVAAPGSTDRVALLIEPRPPGARARRAQRDVLPGARAGSSKSSTAPRTRPSSARSSAPPSCEPRSSDLVLRWMDEAPLAHNELMCTHWRERAAAEHVLIFQTDALQGRQRRRLPEMGLYRRAVAHRRPLVRGQAFSG